MSDASATLQRAGALADLHRWDEATALVSACLATEPGSASALCLLARCHLGAGRDAEAADAARQAAALAPDNDWALRLLSYSAAGLGRVDESIAAASGAITLQPGIAGNHLALANALIRAGRGAEALEPAGRAVRIAPNDPDTHNTLGVSLARSGDPAGATAAYLEALRLEPSHAMAVNNLAVIDLDANRLGKAARGVAAALRSDPGDDVLRRNLDLIGERLVHRLLNAMLLSGLLLAVVLGLEAEGVVPDYWPRALVGLVLIAGYAAVAWATLRNLPAGMRHHLRSLPRRTTRRLRWVVVAVVSATLLLAAFAPVNIASLGILVFLVILRGFQLVLIVLVAMLLWRKVARALRDRRRPE